MVLYTDPYSMFNAAEDVSREGSSNSPAVY
jgi:hypothetical protein